MADLQTAAKRVRSADALLITAGAGMGVDSGLPDFRGNEGFWRAYPMLAKLGLRFEAMANPAWFDQAPELAWAFYGHRLNLYRRTKPHPGFGHLLELGRSKPLGYFVYTSNVDGHFQKAGFDPERIVECHGSIEHWQCTARCCQQIWEAPPQEIAIDEAQFVAQRPLPACHHCGAVARPNVLMFGDGRWLSQRSAAQERRFDDWLRIVKQRAGKIAIIELGAGTAIPAIRQTSEEIAARLGGQLVRINPREPQAAPDATSIATGAVDGLRLLLES
jgi:NAD-dependent SIR2 family protein deacetylase